LNFGSFLSFRSLASFSRAGAVFFDRVEVFRGNQTFLHASNHGSAFIYGLNEAPSNDDYSQNDDKSG